MGAYKQFLTSDIIVTPHEVHREFKTYVTSSNAGLLSFFTESPSTISETWPGNVGTDRYLGTNIVGTLFNPLSDPTSGMITSQYQRLVYNSIKELYYSNYQKSIYGDPVSRPILVPGRDVEGNRYIGSSSSQAYDNYLQSNLTYPRFFPTGSNAIIGVISIPNKIFGDYIQPNSFKLTTESGSFTDDGEGNVISGSQIVGNILYPHGVIVLTGNEYIYSTEGSVYGTATYGVSTYGAGMAGEALNYWTSSLLNAIYSQKITCSFSSSYTIYETQYKCTIRENEFNSTLNPSAMTGSYETGSKSGILNDNLTGSYFDPYITTVGLYDEMQNLLAIGKLSQLLPTSPTTDTTIIINLDR